MKYTTAIVLGSANLLWGNVTQCYRLEHHRRQTQTQAPRPDDPKMTMTVPVITKATHCSGQIKKIQGNSVSYVLSAPGRRADLPLCIASSRCACPRRCSRGAGEHVVAGSEAVSTALKNHLPIHLELAYLSLQTGSKIRRVSRK